MVLLGFCVCVSFRWIVLGKMDLLFGCVVVDCFFV